MPPLTVLRLNDPRWRAFVADHPRATPFHDPAWAQLVADCYGFDGFAVGLADADGAICAGAPMVAVRHLVGRRRWVSLPFTDHCPPLATSEHDERELAAALESAARDAGVAGVELRAPLAGVPASGAPALRHVLELDPDPAVVYARFHPSQVQRSIRKAERAGITVRRSTDAGDLLTAFYELHLRTRQRQGVPIQPRRFFRLIAERVLATGSGWVDVVEAEGRPVAAALFLAGNGTVVYKFGASDEAAWPMRPNHLLFWHAIRAACEAGYHSFDFGRTDAGHDSLATFKRTWGAREEPLVYSALGERRDQGSEDA
ncbi:MAG TPA: GNAT family N-acetyltransferase, partial [Candidatus Limnocylindria bacterium]|nr:GNAT family N-acetyltransferase [Candidatus Limnocylindria bacterium]